MVTACTHKKWKKWEERQIVDGYVVMRRTCKKCGWCEYKIIEGIWIPADFKKGFKIVILEIMKEIELEAIDTGVPVDGNFISGM